VPEVNHSFYYQLEHKPFCVRPLELSQLDTSEMLKVREQLARPWRAALYDAEVAPAMRAAMSSAAAAVAAAKTPAGVTGISGGGGGGGGGVGGGDGGGGGGGGGGITPPAVELVHGDFLAMDRWADAGPRTRSRLAELEHFHLSISNSKATRRWRLTSKNFSNHYTS